MWWNTNVSEDLTASNFREKSAGTLVSQHITTHCQNPEDHDMNIHLLNLVTQAMQAKKIIPFKSLLLNSNDLRLGQ